jgi:hypothetical protein
MLTARLRGLGMPALAVALAAAGVTFMSAGRPAHADVTTAVPTASGASIAVLGGDFTGDGKADIAVTGSQYFQSLPMAASAGDGSFSTTNATGLGTFPHRASTPGAREITGDFNGDGRTDIAVLTPVGLPGAWSTIPVAFSTGAGSFTTTDQPVGNAAHPFISQNAATPGVQPVTGDFNGDGKTDIALVGGQGWTSIPVAYSNGDGTFAVATGTLSNTSFGARASAPGARVLAGDFNGDHKTDIAVLPGRPWDFATIPVAFSAGTGAFTVTESTVGDFSGDWATEPGVQPLTGDFNGDGKTDIALVGGQGWTSIPVASSNGDGSFAVKTDGLSDTLFAAWDATAGVHVLTGDFNGDGKTDIALTAPGWGSVPVALSSGNGTFTVVNQASAFGSWAGSAPGVVMVAGDFNGDHKTDFALAFASWQGIPVAFSAGDGTFSVTNDAVPGLVQYLDGLPGYSGDFDLITCANLQQCQTVDVTGDGRADRIGFVPANTPMIGMGGAVLVDSGQGWRPWGNGFCLNPDETCQVVHVGGADAIADVVQFENDTPPNGVTGNVYVALSNPGAQRFGSLNLWGQNLCPFHGETCTLVDANGDAFPDTLDHTNSARPGEGNTVYVAYGQFTGFAAPVRTS